MPYANPDALVGTAWLAANLTRPDLRVVDGTYYLPMQKRNAKAEFVERHIPGAVFFDIDEIADTDSKLPHMLPSPEKFASRVGRLGLGDGARIVVYDGQGMMSAARVWWTFRAFGHDDVAVLDGGLPKWLKEGRPVDAGEARPPDRKFTARPNRAMVRDKARMLANLASRREQVVDARSAGRFDATEPEIWPGRRSGHIPGSLNLPFTDLLDPADKTFVPAERMAERFRAAGIDMRRPVVATCGSGVTASVLAFGLHLLGHADVAVYDGSWAEWGLPGDTPVEP